MRVVICSFLLIALSFQPLFAAQDEIHIALFLLEPFMMRDEKTGESAGVTVDYWREYVAPRMGLTVRVSGPFPIRRVEMMLQNGEVDVVPLFTKIPSREERFLFPETHLTEITSVLMVRPDSPITEVKGAEILYNKKIGFLEQAYIPPMLRHPSITFEFLADEDYRQLNLNKLWAGRVDALLDINYLSLRYYLRQKNYENRVRIVSLPVERVKVYSVFRKTAEGELLKKQYDKINREGLKQGVFSRMSERYF